MATLTTQSSAGPVASTSFGTTSPVTGSAPSDSLDGLSMRGLAQVSVWLSVGSAVTFSNAGSLLAYEWSPVLGRWGRNPSCDISLASFSSISVRDIMAGVVFPAQFNTNKSSNEAARIQYVPSGVTFSSGSGGVTVTLMGSKEVMASNGQGV
jgi:hypothetical protein